MKRDINNTVHAKAKHNTTHISTRLVKKSLEPFCNFLLVNWKSAENRVYPPIRLIRSREVKLNGKSASDEISTLGHMKQST